MIRWSILLLALAGLLLRGADLAARPQAALEIFPHSRPSWRGQGLTMHRRNALGVIHVQSEHASLGNKAIGQTGLRVGVQVHMQLHGVVVSYDMPESVDPRRVSQISGAEAVIDEDELRFGGDCQILTQAGGELTAHAVRLNLKSGDIRFRSGPRPVATDGAGNPANDDAR